MRAHPRLRRLVLAGVVLALLAGAAIAILSSRQPGDVSNPNVEFNAKDRPRAKTVDRATSDRGSSFSWPTYGYDAGRTRYLPLRHDLRPPFAERWTHGGNVLLEFPPALGGRSVFSLRDDARLEAISRRSGRLLWKRHMGHLAASSPAYANGTVYVTILERGRGTKGGRVVAVNAANGHTRWSVRLQSRSESSPLVDHGTVYFGSENGTVYALRARDGAVRWTHRAPGAVKGGLALDRGRLFLGTYGGTVQALRRDTGGLIWSTGTSGGSFGLRSGNFYATPAAAFGRVYIGNTDGFVYSFAQSSGKLAWRKKTGGYVYSSAAVAQVPGTPPTVYVGSYDRHVYAFDAQSGSVRWKHHTEGRVSGGIVVLGDLVWYSTLARTTTAITAGMGRQIWFTRRGGFNPVVATDRDIILVGYTTLYGLDGRPPKTGPQAEADRRARAREARRVALIRRVMRRRAALNRRVAARRAAIRRRNALIRSGGMICTRRGGKVSCHRPRPLFCSKQGKYGPTICRAYGTGAATRRRR